MGCWENTTYVNHGSAPEVAEALTALFAREGMERFHPPPRVRRLVEPMQYEGALQNDVWGFVVFPGAPGWTVVKTAPLELLAERREGVDRMRLAELCRALSARAVHINVYDTTDTVFARVSRRGAVRVSGSNTAHASMWHGEALDGTLRFILRKAAEILSGRGGDDHARTLAARFAGEHAGSCDNHVSVLTLVQHDALEVPGAVARYLRWTGASRQRAVATDSWQAYRARRGDGPR